MKFSTTKTAFSTSDKRVLKSQVTQGSALIPKVYQTALQNQTNDMVGHVKTLDTLINKLELLVDGCLGAERLQSLLKEFRKLFINPILNQNAEILQQVMEDLRATWLLKPDAA